MIDRRLSMSERRKEWRWGLELVLELDLVKLELGDGHQAEVYRAQKELRRLIQYPSQN